MVENRIGIQYFHSLFDCGQQNAAANADGGVVKIHTRGGVDTNVGDCVFSEIYVLFKFLIFRLPEYADPFDFKMY